MAVRTNFCINQLDQSLPVFIISHYNVLHLHDPQTLLYSQSCYLLMKFLMHLLEQGVIFIWSPNLSYYLQYFLKSLPPLILFDEWGCEIWAMFFKCFLDELSLCRRLSHTYMIFWKWVVVLISWEIKIVILFAFC